MPVQLNYQVNFVRGPMRGLAFPQKALFPNQVDATRFIDYLQRLVASGRVNFTFTVDANGMVSLRKFQGLDANEFKQSGPLRQRGMDLPEGLEEGMKDNEDQPSRMDREREHDLINAVAVHTQPEQDRKNSWSFINHDEGDVEEADYDDEFDDLDDVLDNADDFEFHEDDEDLGFLDLSMLTEAHIDLARALELGVKSREGVTLKFSDGESVFIDPISARQILREHSHAEINHMAQQDSHSLAMFIAKAINLHVPGVHKIQEGLVSLANKKPEGFTRVFEEVLQEAAFKVISRVRGGKIQRRVKVSAQPGYTVRGGKLKKISPAEHRRRVMANKRGAIKRRAKLRQALRKRAISMRRRRMALGGR